MLTLNTFMKYDHQTLKFGDYILFQEYEDAYNKNIGYKISNPILCVYLGLFLADQTLGFKYIKWFNDAKNDYFLQRIPIEICEHYEWMNYIDILGHWHYKPSWKEILKSYRLRNKQQSVLETEINID